MKKDWLQFRLIRYLLTGGIATLVHVSLAFAGIYFFTWHVWVANTLAFFIAFAVSYTLQSHFVFQHPPSIQTLKRFFCVQTTGLFCAQFITHGVPEINDYLRVLAVVVLLPFISYFIHKCWTFRHENITHQG